MTKNFITLKNQEPWKSKIKQLDFTGETIFIALDVHRKNWRVTIGSKEFELEHYTQSPNVKDLARHSKRNYPGAKYMVTYEAGFCGFGIQRSLKVWDTTFFERRRNRLHRSECSRYTYIK